MNKARLIARVIVAGLIVTVASSGCLILIDGDTWENLDADLTISAEWDSDYRDVDLHVSYPWPNDGDNAPNTTDDNGGDPVFEGLYDDGDGANGDFGFFLSDDAIYREIVSPSRQESSFTAAGAASVEMTQEGKDGGAEIVVIRRPPFESTNLVYRTNPNNSLGLSTSYESFAWIGVGEVYVHGDSGALVTSGGYSAGVVVTVYDENENALARISLPEDIDLTSMSVARIHYFVARDFGGDTFNYYVIVPDVRTMVGISEFRNVGSGVVFGEGVIGVAGSARE